MLHGTHNAVYSPLHEQEAGDVTHETVFLEQFGCAHVEEQETVVASQPQETTRVQAEEGEHVEEAVREQEKVAELVHLLDM